MPISQHKITFSHIAFGSVIKVLLTLMLIQLLMLSTVQAKSELPRFLSAIKSQEIFPNADKLGKPIGDPFVAPAYEKGKQVGLVYLTSDYVNTIGYSGKPIHQLISIDMQGIIKKVLLVEHHEPIVLIGIPEKRITRVLDDYEGLDVGELVRGTQKHQVDAVSGATVTIMVMDDNILRSAIKVARKYGLSGLKAKAKQSAGPVASVNQELNIVKSWKDLIAEGAVQSLKISLKEINKAFKETGNQLAIDNAEEGEDKEVFIELYAAMVSIPSIGRSVLGENEYKNLMKKLQPGEQAIALAGDGRFSFKGSGYVRGGIFDRFQIIQEDTSVRFHDRYHKRLRKVAADGAPDLKDVDLFRTPADLKFNAALPWTLQLLVGRDTGPTSKVFLTFDLNYKVPNTYLSFTEVDVVKVSDADNEFTQASAPIWKKMWEMKVEEVVVLSLALIVLTAIFFFQGWLVKRPVLNDRVRVGFLVFTLVVLGWYFNAQLSVVNILAMFNAFMTGFDWSYFLMEPLTFILWGSVAAALLFWGRGPYCGWLCPFGALQELINRIAKIFSIKQITVPWAIHERIWTFKYLIFLLLFGFSLYSLDWAEHLAEVEPFKTAIILKFVREWPFVIFALAVLIPGIFIERFYCRYICPLGAALAIPGRMRMFSWLKRYKECGSPCQRCSNECMVQAIHPEGNINVNECLYCLHCQVVYSDEHACPVMIQKRLKKARQTARAEASALASSVKSEEKSAIKMEINKEK